MSDAIPSVYGLILAGGSSTRMRRDKASLEYAGEPQLDRVFALARRHLPEVYVSVRADQTGDRLRAGRPLVVDAFDGGGPIVGIRSALALRPDVAWLVLACDLPFLSDEVLRHLLRERAPQGVATAYRSRYDGLPEPLCAIWEPGAAAPLASWQSAGRSCPRKFLVNHPVKLIEPLEARALDNVNTPEEYQEALAVLDHGAG